jgi:hypothetical protein
MKGGIQIFLKMAIFTTNATSQLRNALGIQCLLSVTTVCRNRRCGWGLEFLNITSGGQLKCFPFEIEKDMSLS